MLRSLLRRDLPNSSHKGEAIWKGLKKSKYYVGFLSELSLRPMKDDPFTGLDATEGHTSDITRGAREEVGS